jgi:hypothetical protein
MADLEVVLELPERIELGLANGTLERIGGVIVERGSRQIVAWLRDSGDIVTAIDPAQTLGLASQAFGTLAGTGILLNIALSSASLVSTMQRVDRLSEAVAKLAEQQSMEFKRDRDTRFRSALQSARDALDAKNESTREQRAHQASQGLYEAQDSLLRDYDEVIDHDPTAAQHYLTRAMYACTSRIRCYLEIEEIDLARDRLGENLEEFRTYTERLVERSLGKHPAVFLHRDFERPEVERFLAAQQWLLRIDDFIEILERLRADFWNPEALETESANSPTALFKQLRSVTSRKSVNLAERYQSGLGQAEAVIENYQRLEGFLLELRSMRLSTFREWRNLVTEEHLEEQGIGIIIDTDRLSDIH